MKTEMYFDPSPNDPVFAETLFSMNEKNTK